MKLWGKFEKFNSDNLAFMDFDDQYFDCEISLHFNKKQREKKPTKEQDIEKKSTESVKE